MTIAEMRDINEAIDIVATDIIRNAVRRYPPGHPMRDLPSMAVTVEYQFKRGRYEDARHRATITHRYIELYEPEEQRARIARDLLLARMVEIAGRGALQEEAY